MTRWEVYLALDCSASIKSCHIQKKSVNLNFPEADHHDSSTSNQHEPNDTPKVEKARVAFNLDFLGEEDVEHNDEDD